jgi:hypothetical protein
MIRTISGSLIQTTLNVDNSLVLYSESTLVANDLYYNVQAYDSNSIIFMLRPKLRSLLTVSGKTVI